MSDVRSLELDQLNKPNKPNKRDKPNEPNKPNEPADQINQRFLANFGYCFNSFWLCRKLNKLSAY